MCDEASMIWCNIKIATHWCLGFGEVDVSIKQHCDVLVSRFQSYGQSAALILVEQTK